VRCFAAPLHSTEMSLGPASGGYARLPEGVKSSLTLLSLKDEDFRSLCCCCAAWMVDQEREFSEEALLSPLARFTRRPKNFQSGQDTCFHARGVHADFTCCCFGALCFTPSSSPRVCLR